MPGGWADALARLDEDLDAHLGETVQVTPMRPGDFAVTPDPDRPAFDVMAQVFEHDGSTADISKLGARVPYEEVEVAIRRALLAGRTIRKNDEVLLVDRPGALRFRVMRVETIDRERVALTLSQTKGE